MALIKIVKGVYGYLDGATVKPKTPKDAPFELNDKRAAELVPFQRQRRRSHHR